jgi:hypothetical protein
MEAAMSDKEAVLDLLKRGAFSAQEIEKALVFPAEQNQRRVRRAIDGLRAKGEPVWHDMVNRFFWKDDLPAPTYGGHNRWKRTFNEEIQGGK